MEAMATPERTLFSILRRDTLDIERTECIEESESVASIIRARAFGWLYKAAAEAGGMDNVLAQTHNQ